MHISCRIFMYKVNYLTDIALFENTDILIFPRISLAGLAPYIFVASYLSIILQHYQYKTFSSSHC